jgi:hypothetical protein
MAFCTCTDHKTDIKCPSCTTAMMMRHDRMLELLNKFSKGRTGQFDCRGDSFDLLEEIGRLPEKKESK